MRFHAGQIPKRWHTPFFLSMTSQSTLLRLATGEFTTGTHTHADLSCRFKLYVPPEYTGQPLPLVVMLHGCSQGADDFAAGTGMNQRARDDGFFVLYPEQTNDANPNGCWNWFQRDHQQRGAGEPALLASLTQAIMGRHGVDPRRVFVAGMSAGGAMATIVAGAYPELFSAVGVHSGLPTRDVTSMDEALTLMNRGESSMTQTTPVDPSDLPPVPTGFHQKPIMVFHGDQDSTVHPNNGEQVVMAVLDGAPFQVEVEPGTSSNGRRYTRRIYTNGQGRVLAEYWLVHGTGHAWSGGSLQGSYTDRHGPDATGEMLRFFFAQVS
jgi:poly(hydroxyalkanoate) depolymerase family esterase